MKRIAVKRLTSSAISVVFLVRKNQVRKTSSGQVFFTKVVATRIRVLFSTVFYPVLDIRNDSTGVAHQNIEIWSCSLFLG